MATFVMSYPGPGWAPRRPGVLSADVRPNPRAAMQEWLEICDHITRAGGHIFVVDPPPAGERAPSDGPDPVFAAHLGMLFSQPQAGGEPVFLRANASDHAAQVLAGAGLDVRRSEHPFGGQPDVIALGSNRFVLTYPEGHKGTGLGMLHDLLPRGARVLEVALRAPHRHGHECFCPLVSTGGAPFVLLNAGGLASADLAEVAAFAGRGIEVCPIAPDDAAAHVCSALSVRGRVLLPAGASATVRGRLVRLGLTLVEVELPQLLGLGGGGPRSLVNELLGFVMSDAAPSYAVRREELLRLPAAYPEAPAPGPGGAVPGDGMS